MKVKVVHSLFFQTKMANKTIKFSHQSKRSLMLIYFGTFKILLHFFTKKVEAIIGTTVANSHNAETFDMEIKTANTLVERFF